MRKTVTRYSAAARYGTVGVVAKVRRIKKNRNRKRPPNDNPKRRLNSGRTPNRKSPTNNEPNRKSPTEWPTRRSKRHLNCRPNRCPNCRPNCPNRNPLRYAPSTNRSNAESPKSPRPRWRPRRPARCPNPNPRRTRPRPRDNSKSPTHSPTRYLVTVTTKFRDDYRKTKRSRHHDGLH